MTNLDWGKGAENRNAVNPGENCSGYVSGIDTREEAQIAVRSFTIGRGEKGLP